MPKDSKGSVNKSAWIRQQPTHIPARELVDQARKEGINISIQQVYSVRHEAKIKAAAEGSQPAKPVDQLSRGSWDGGAIETPIRKLSPVNERNQPSSSVRQEFMRLATRLGTDEMRRLIEQLELNQGMDNR